MEMAISLTQFAFEVSEGLFLRSVKNHGRWNSVPMKHQGQCLVGLAFLSHGKGPFPPKRGGIDLGILIPPLGGPSSDKRVGENRVWHPFVTEHAVIGWESAHERRVNTRSNTMLGCPEDGLFGLRRRDHPPGSKGQGVNGRGLTQNYMSIQRCVYTGNNNMRS
jgi:hypothetical protein